MTFESIFADLERLQSAGKPREAVAVLVEHFEAGGQLYELFEALKMQTRLELGLSAAQSDPADGADAEGQAEERLDEATEHKLEQGLLDACRRVGQLFIGQGRIREGWMYLRPVGDRQLAARAFAQVDANEDNLDEMIEVLVHEGVDIRRGYALALQHLGTCNSITLFESALAARPRSDQQVASELLVRHVHAELLENLCRDIERREAAAPEGTTAEMLLSSRADLLRDGTYHLDTSHLASTVRFARVLDNQEALRMALDISIYGRSLHPQFQYPGEEPFLDLYPASIAFFRALLGEQVDPGLRYFTHKADSVPQADFGTVAVEVLIDLMSRCGRHDDALAMYEKRLPPGARTMGIAPTLMQLSQRAGSFDRMRDICKRREDLLSFAAAILQTPKKS